MDHHVVVEKETGLDNVVSTHLSCRGVRARVLTSSGTTIPQIDVSDNVSTSPLRTSSSKGVECPLRTTLHGVHPPYSTHTTLGVGGLLLSSGQKGRAQAPSTRGLGERAQLERSERPRARGGWRWYWTSPTLLLAKARSKVGEVQYHLLRLGGELFLPPFFLKFLF